MEYKSSIEQIEKYNLHPLEPWDREFTLDGEKYEIVDLSSISFKDCHDIKIPFSKCYRVIKRQSTNRLQMIKYEGRWLRFDTCVMPKMFDADVELEGF